MKLPARLHLPSGTEIELTAKPSPRLAERRAGAPLFSEVFEADVTTAPPLESLSLADFHVVRAVLTKCGLVAEAPVDVTCANCGHALHVVPCEGLEIGPWVDGELGDPELDATLPFGEPHDIPPVPLGRVRVATTIVLDARTVAQARPFWEAGEITAAVVRAMGIRSLGPEDEPARIAAALREAPDEAWDGVAEVFLASHYPRRLGTVVFCPSCKARNEIDAPYERELDAGSFEAPAARPGFPSFDAFAERAHAIGAPLLAEIGGEAVQLVLDEGTPAVDEGGVPLLGAYDAPYPGHPPRITVWWQTFKTEHDEDPEFDWDAELRETIEHEIEHHVNFLRGDDPLDDEEREEIRDEARRLVGRREAERRALGTFRSSLGDFARRSWLLWLIVAIAAVLTYLAQR